MSPVSVTNGVVQGVGVSVDTSVMQAKPRRPAWSATNVKTLSLAEA
jgi:hypothetical protein